MSFNIEDELKKLPKTPGVYMHKDSLGEVIYVGKAVNLRSRVRQYFRKQDNQKVKALVENIAEFEYISCATEMEALILECNLIKKYMPKYNILLKDDKSYPYIKVTVSEPFPRVIRTRRLERDGSSYFGPYSDVSAVSEILKMIDELYPLKKCSTINFRPDVRPCLNYHIGKCGGVCVNLVDKKEYQEKIDEIIDFLNGKNKKIINSLEKKMIDASDNLRYEEAAKYRDYMVAIKKLSETQRASMVKDRDADILIPVLTYNNGIVVKYKVRDGKLLEREINYLSEDGFFGGKSSREQLIEAYIKQSYSISNSLPREIILNTHLREEELLTEYLDKVNEENAKSGNDILHKTKIQVPERGEKKALLEMAIADSLELAKSLDERALREKERVNALKKSISSIITKCAELNLTLPALISEEDDRQYRVEAYDISNLNGLDTVGAMVVYEGLKPVRNDYRKFKIKTDTNGDDYASLQEVIYRRLKRLKDKSDGFNICPDLIFIDGGLGQVHAVMKVMKAFGIMIPVVGLAKDDSHRTRAVVFDDGTEIDLKKDKLLFSYTGTIQEEVHRFAITFLRSGRSKKMLHSALEDIPLIGPKRREALLKHFGTIDAIKNASYEELLEAPFMNAKTANSVIEFFEKRGSKTDK